MQIESLAKALNFFDMRDVSTIIEEQTVNLLRVKLENLFANQEALDLATDNLQLETMDEDFKN